MLLIASLSFVACSDDNNEEDIDLSGKVTGTYVGSGKLSYYGVEIDTWQGMKVVLTRSSNSYVLVDLLEADNSSIFDAPTVCQIMQSSNSYVLTSDENPYLKIEIDSQKNMNYTNSAVIVDNERGYTISFSGKKE